MSVIDVLQECRDAGIRIAARDGKLLVGDAQSRLSPDLRRRLAEHKSEILAYLDASEPAPVPRIVHHPDVAEHPLSYAQRRLWFLHQLDPGSVEYNLSLALRVRGRLETDALNAALDAIVARHAVLRTGFAERDGEPLQVVYPHRRLRVGTRDLAALEPEARQREALRIAREEARAPFDLLGQAPMLRCTLLRLGDEEHAIVLTMHHIATDGWSMGVLVKEFMAHYAAAVQGGSAGLPPLAIQYGDYARWQHAARASGMLRESMDYWAARLAGLPEVHDLPLDHPRPPRQRFTAQRHHQLLGRTALDAAKRLAKDSGATLFMVLQSAFAHLLSRWSGQREIVIGTPTAGRDQPETAPLIGFFNNTVICRFDIEPGADARGLIAHGRTVALDAFTHQQVPFDLLVETFRPRRSLAYNPLCQIKFVLQNHDGGALELPGLRFEPLAPGGEHVHFDLDLTATEREDGLHLGWTFKDELFEPASVERMAGAYARLLHAMCDAPGLALDRIGLADPVGTRELLALGRGPTAEQGRHATLVHAFECTARDVPECIAVRCGERSLTYRELDLRANRLAHALIEQGMGSGDRVGVRLGRSIELLIGLLATHKAGAAYVPLDGRQSATQLHSLVENAQLRVVLHHSADPVHAAGVDTVFMDGADSDPRWLEGYPCVRPGVQVTLDDSAYVLYTSGSTGMPKGVEVTHRGMVDYCAFARAGYYAAGLSGSFVATSPAFDLTLPTLFVPLLAGDSVEMLAEDDALSALAARLAAADCDNRLLRLTPSHVQGLLYLLDEVPLPQAHSFVIGGERFAVETARALQARFPAARIYNHYGPTETVVGCCWYDVSANLGALARTVPIGRPMDNTVLYVLDAALQPVPLGVPGELYIGGAGVARGYLGQPGLTAERFLEDPFAAAERVYRSGDRVRWRADGQLEFLGRADDQVKLRGFRIELGEIEHHLAGAPGVRRAAVRLIGEGETARIVGYVEPTFAAEGIAGLRAALAHALPAYMLPTAIVALDALPLTVNGKVDRRALPVPAEDDGTAVSEAPTTDTERRMAALWQRILKRERIDRGANFFAMGGHSLLATRLVGEIAREFGKPLPVRAVFEHSTLQELAAHLDAQAHTPGQSISVVKRGVPLPLSFAQQRLWFVDRLEGGSAQFNMPSALRLSGAFEPALFQRALDALVERHEILRTVYIEHEDGPVQQILAASASPLTVHDLRELEDVAREARVQALRREEAVRPFDLATDPVLRCALLRLRENETVVLLTVHHIASDGWSNGVLARELVELYGAFRDGRAPALAPLPVQYADYALWQRHRLQGGGMRADLDYWRQRLAGIPWLHSLPLDRPRPAQQDFSGKVHLQFLDAGDTAALRAFCAQRGITLFVLMRAIFSMLIGRASREQDIVLGTPVAGRVHRDLEGLIGLFVNTLVLRTELDGNPPFDALLEHCRRDSLEAYAHQEIPFETLVDELKPARSLSYNPLVQILLNVFESVQDDPSAVEGMAASAVGSEAPESLSKADMTLYVRHCDDRLLLKWSYRSSLFEAATVQRLDAGFCELLRQAIAAPQSRILDYALLSEAGRRATVAQAAPTPRDYDAALLHERVHAHAQAMPDATALMHGHDRIDYATLDARARSLASELQGLGIAAGATVGILADRGIDYAVAVMSCLNAGMVYLPLAADLPQARIDYMLRDAEARAVLVQPRLRERADGIVPVIALGARSSPASESATELPRLQAGDGAHLLFTSGSTGQPKSVLGTHGALRNRVAWMLEAFPFAEDEVCCLITSTAFVRAVWELAVPLAAGRPLLIVDAQTVSDLAAFAHLLAEHRVTRIVTAPSLARALTELPEAATLLSGLRYWFVSGEPLRPGIARRIRSMLPGVVLCNLYGSTETMSDVSFHVVGDDEPRGSIPIGKPIANSALLVLDEHLRPVPPGMPGEICVAGANLAVGYPGRATLTADKFVRHDFGMAFGERLYRTGDLGRVLADGAIECLGRLDHQVKVRGYRIELGEIEASLLRSTRVKDAVVTVHGGGEEGRLVAYLVAQTAGEDVAAAVRAELRAWLPEYMQPSAYVVMERLPLTANGKVDRRSLPAPEPAAGAYAPARTPTESTVAQVWCELLKLARVGSGDNFFEIGGHSLLATRMASALSARTGKAVSVRMVFEAPVLADIAQRIDAQTEAAQAPIPRASRSGGIPLSLAQQRLWFVSRFEGGTQYNLPTSLRIVGELDTAALQSALDALVARHEVLRTTYAERDGDAVQIVHPPAPVSITAIDLSRLDDAHRAEELQRLSRDDARMPFDLGSGSVLRCTLIALAPQEHALLFTVHHIASDGWSKGLLVREFVAVYAAQARGEAASLTPLDVQYADYAAWQRSPEQARAIAGDLDYWKGQLAQLPQVHALPLDRTRPARQDYRAGKVVRRMQRPELERLRRLALDHDATLFMALQAGLALLLGRWSGETDVVIGSPVAGRTRRELEPLIGFFINSLALRFDLSGNPDVHTLLARARRTVLDAFAHQSASFEMLVETLRPERHLSHAPLFQVVLALQNHERGTLSLPGLAITALSNDTHSIDLDLHVAVTEDEYGLQFRWLYATSLFDAATIERMAESYLAVLAAMAEAPDQPAMALPLLPESDRLAIAQWAVPQLQELPDVCAHVLFEQQVAADPQAIAATFEGECISYSALNAQANRVAHWLRGEGVGPGQRVGLCVERSLDMLVGVLGILKSGAAYLPVDPAYPQERVEAMLVDGEVEHVLAHASVLEALALLAERTLLLLDAELRTPLMAGYPQTDPTDTGVDPAHAAYAVFTSGSTGVPKGVLNTHRGLVNLALYQRQALAVGPASRVLAFGSISFDGGVFEWLLALAHGGSLHICSEDDRHSVQRLSALLVRERITHAAIPPALLAQMPLERDYALQLLIVAGEACDEGLAWRWAERCRVVNSYGPSEAAVAATHAEIVPQSPVTLGRALPNVEAHVFNACGQPQPLGVPGELHLGGAGLALGYLGRPALTAERFMPHPEGSGRLYRTGDLVRWLPGGELQFLGRADDQVKIRGFRVELGEVAQHLLAHPRVREAVAIVRDETGDARLVAYVVPAGDAWAHAGRELREHMRARVPDYLVPVAVMVMEALPLNRNGKVDKAALPQPDYAAKQEFIAPDGDTAQRVASIWQRVLKQERISAESNFFEIGGHSLLATQVISHVAEEFGRDIPIRAVFEHPTIAGFARHVDAVANRDAPPTIVATVRDRPLPLSFSQQRLWFIDRLGGGSAQYNMRFGVRLTGTLDDHAVQQAIDAIIARHEVLRTTFAIQDGESVQIVHPPSPQAIGYHDLSPLADEAREAALDRIVRAEAARGFDLTADPMLRCTLVRLDDAGHALLLSTHHIASDGWSMNVLGREFAALYAGFRCGEPVALAPLRVQYGDYASWQRGVLEHSGALRTQLDYWHAALAGLPPVHALPLDKPRPPLQQFDGDHVARRLDASSLKRLKQLALDNQASLFMVLQSALAVLIGRWSGETDIVIGTPVAGRTQRALEPLIGFFINSLVLRTDLSGDPGFLDVVRRARTTILDAYAHQDVPFEMLVETLRPERSLSHSPLYQISFTLHNHEESQFVLPGLDLSPLRSDAQQCRYDLELHMTETDAGIHIRWVYATGLFERDTIERMADAFQVLVAHLLDAPGTSVNALPLLDDEARAALLPRLGDIPHGCPADLPLHRLFEARAAEQPDAVAVTFGDSRWSYGELNRRANRVAHGLIAMGIKPDDRVALCAPRGPHLLAGLLGILKAGGAYVPLDPAYPQERLHWLILDSMPVALVAAQGPGHSLPPTMVARLDLHDEAGLARHAEDNPNVPGLDAGHLAYVIYTSGSTGTPKGVQVEHRQVSRLLAATEDHFRFGADETWSLFHSFAFDFSVWEIWGALAYGGRLVVVSDECAKSPDDFYALLCRERVTMLNQTPSAFRQLSVAQACSGQTHFLRTVIFGGEALDPKTLGPWAERNDIGRTRLVNMYGITETTVHVTLRDLRLEDIFGRGGSVIGRPIPGMHVYILDPRMQPTPIGVAGEIYVGGSGVARGYLNREELNAQRFVRNPFDASGTHGRLYRSGDLARWTAAGEIDYLGRNDFQVKIRGFRIELGEIEARLARMPEVREVTVLAREDGPGEKRLVAYVVAEAGATVDISLLRQTLIEELPDYMVPKAFVALAALPLTGNGKLDRRALPVPDRADVTLRDYAEPVTDTERAISKLWTDLMNLPCVSRFDDFFELGGHSVLAIRLMAMLSEQFQVRLHIRDLFRHPLLVDLARHVDDVLVRGDSDWDPLVQLDATPGVPLLYCVPAAGLTAVAYRPLAKALQGRLALRVFEPCGTDGAMPPSRSMEETVALNLRALLACQPQGPYLLAGHSYGGAVAFEMARLLEMRGHQVQLTLIDSGVYLREAQCAEHSLGGYLARMLGANAEDVQPMQGFDDEQRLHAFFLQRLQQQGVAVAPQVAVPRGLLDVFRAQLAIHRHYGPSGRFGGPVVSILAREGAIARLPSGELAEHYGAYAAAQVEMHVAEGGHLSLLSADHAPGLADLIAARQADRRIQHELPV
ncbi:non-ribosomal peptide synthetase [Xanthomonas sp. SS]|uniref:non-ribosomal peptide synthetase n=1 Tax=Xanthomonas sp. SS TaxID=2724122 RepID=UPI00163ADAFF|nr:non-ribosomal peptide synthetase [Xanthomonas sp. SS]QNH16239.1 non-ribosomal peptide synthetase [Xanthomonas sp. SS]